MTVFKTSFGKSTIAQKMKLVDTGNKTPKVQINYSTGSCNNIQSSKITIIDQVSVNHMGMSLEHDIDIPFKQAVVLCETAYSYNIHPYLN